MMILMAIKHILVFTLACVTFFSGCVKTRVSETLILEEDDYSIKDFTIVNIRENERNNENEDKREKLWKIFIDNQQSELLQP